jgi:hypothetical protein
MTTILMESSPPEECAEGSRSVALAEVAHSLALADQWADIKNLEIGENKLTV